MKPDTPQKAILLAAGFGSRITPLSHDLPKPMMPLWGIPIIEHTVNAMQQFGVRDILINLHHNPTPIVEWAKSRKSSDPRIQFSFEPEIAGTGGALKQASHFIGTQPFWMVNTDIAFSLDPKPIITDFHQHQPLATLWMDATRGPRTVELSPKGLIADFASSTPGAPKTYTFCGLQLLSPAILDYLSDTPFSTVVDAYRRALAQGVAVRGCALSNTFWADLGTPERYLAAHRDIEKARRHHAAGGNLMQAKEVRRMQRCIPSGAKKEGVVAIGRGVKLPSDISLCNTVIWDNAKLADGVRLCDAIVGREAIIRGTHLGDATVQANVVPQDAVLSAALKKMRSRASNTSLSALPARGSDRSFTRLQSSVCSRILVRYDDANRPENARYAPLTRALTAAGIRVPRVVLDLPAQRATLFEDAGTQSLQDALQNCPRQTRQQLYRRVIRQVLKLHALSPDSLPSMEPAFSTELYRWEHNLFMTHFMKNTLHTEISRSLKQVLNRCADILKRQPQGPVHRDLQSSNILLQDGNPVLIDFQGMRLGAAAYDLASLLCDPYIMLDNIDRHVLLEVYCKQSPHGTTIREAFVPAAIQRLSQALGAFGRLAATPATARFAHYIPAATKMLNTMLTQFMQGEPTIPLLPIYEPLTADTR